MLNKVKKIGEKFLSVYFIMFCCYFLIAFVGYLFYGDIKTRSEAPPSSSWFYSDRPFLVQYHYDTGVFDYNGAIAYKSEDDCLKALRYVLTIESEILPICSQKMPEDLDYQGNLRGYRGGPNVTDKIEELTNMYKSVKLSFITSEYIDDTFQDTSFTIAGDFTKELQSLFRTISLDGYVYFITPGSDVLQIESKISTLWNVDEKEVIDFKRKTRMSYALLSSNFRSTMNHLLEDRNRDQYKLTVRIGKLKLNQLDLVNDYLRMIQPK